MRQMARVTMSTRELDRLKCIQAVVDGDLYHSNSRACACSRPRSLQGAATVRIDGREKVTGAARYGSDFAPGSLAWAYLKTSAIAKGRIVDFEERAARAVPGVLEILTWRDVGDRVSPGEMMLPDGYMGSTIAPLRSEQILHAGQIVAVVVAESFEFAREAAHVLEVRYEPASAAGTFDDPDVTTAPAGKKNPRVGDFGAAFAAAPVRVDARYETATQHHNPLELFTTVAAWEGEQLTIWESSQNVWGFKNGLAVQLGITADDIRVVSPFVGGAFGSRGSLTQRTALIALAARRVGGRSSLSQHAIRASASQPTAPKPATMYSSALLARASCLRYAMRAGK